jgi:hypothetical protein
MIGLPTRSEYHSHGVANDVWYTQEQLYIMRWKFYEDISIIMSILQMNIKEAIKYYSAIESWQIKHLHP